MTTRFKSLGREFAIFLGYCVLTVLLTWPLARYLGLGIPGIGSDPFAHFWRNWWMSYALTTSSVSLLHTPMLFHPVGVPSLLSALPFGFAHVIISSVIPNLLSYNILFLLQFALSAYGCYRLALYMLKDRWAAIYSGMLFGISPFMLAKGMGHCIAVHAVSIPLAMLEFFKALDRNEYAPKRAVLAGFWAGITALTAVYFAIYLGLWFLGLAIWLIVKKRSGWIRNWITTVVIMVLMALPKAILMIQPAAEGSFLSIKTLGKWYLTSIDLLGIITPHWNHPIWGDFLNCFNISSPERAAFIGISVLILAIIGWRRHVFNNWRVWLGLWTIIAWILSLGPMLQVAGKPTFIPLPDALLTFVPVINAVTSVSMWMILAVLGVALLAGGGVAWLHQRGNWWRWTWLIAILVAVVEFLPNPYPVIQLKHPVVLKQLRNDQTETAVLSLPIGGRDTMGEIGIYDPMSMWYQTLHEKPTFGGRITRMGPAERGTFDSDLTKTIIHAQDSATSPKNTQPTFNPRAQGIRTKILEWVEKDSWLAGLMKKVIGQGKLTQVLNKAKRNPIEKPEEPILIQSVQLDSITALHQADSLKIGYVLATDLSSPIVRGGLELCKSILPLELVGEESGVGLYKINYPD